LVVWQADFPLNSGVSTIMKYKLILFEIVSGILFNLCYQRQSSHQKMFAVLLLVLEFK